MSAGYTINTTAAVALSAATAKTILNVIAASSAPVRIVEFGVSFDGVTSTAVPVLVELCKSTQGAAGTSSSQTPVQISGATRTVQASGARNYTVEPTTLTVIKEFLVHPQTAFVMQAPLGREAEAAGGAALCVRVTAPATVNVRGYIQFEEG